MVITNYLHNPPTYTCIGSKMYNRLGTLTVYIVLYQKLRIVNFSRFSKKKYTLFITRTNYRAITKYVCDYFYNIVQLIGR